MALWWVVLLDKCSCRLLNFELCQGVRLEMGGVSFLLLGWSFRGPLRLLVGVLWLQCMPRLPWLLLRWHERVVVKIGPSSPSFLLLRRRFRLRQVEDADMGASVGQLFAVPGQEVRAVGFGLTTGEAIPWSVASWEWVDIGLGTVVQLLVALGLGSVEDEKGPPSEAPRSIPGSSVVFEVAAWGAPGEDDDVVVATIAIVFLVIFFRASALFGFLWLS